MGSVSRGSVQPRPPERSSVLEHNQDRGDEDLALLGSPRLPYASRQNEIFQRLVGNRTVNAHWIKAGSSTTC